MSVADKRCTVCAELKPLSEFPSDRQKRTGRSPHCLSCNASKARAASAAYAARTDEQIAADQARLRADGQKWCGGCRSRLPLASFRMGRRSADGLQTRCRDCQKAYRKARAS